MIGEPQGELFAPSKRYPEGPGYRDAPASKAAARFIEPRAGPLRRRVLDRYRALHPAGASADEIAAALEISLWSIRPRCTELKRLGFLERTPELATNESGCAAHRLRASALALRQQDE